MISQEDRPLNSIMWRQHGKFGVNDVWQHLNQIDWHMTPLESRKPSSIWTRYIVWETIPQSLKHISQWWQATRKFANGVTGSDARNCKIVIESCSTTDARQLFWRLWYINSWWYCGWCCTRLYLRGLPWQNRCRDKFLSLEDLNPSLVRDFSYELSWREGDSSIDPHLCLTDTYITVPTYMFAL